MENTLLRWVLVGCCGIGLLACGSCANQAGDGGGRATIKVTSTAFGEGAAIPQKYTQDGQNISPPLAWTGVPKEAKALALILRDPDAPSADFVHWIAFNLPPDTTGLPENAKVLPAPGAEGTNDAGKLGYVGPAPPSGTHHYYFTVYALDQMLDLQTGADKRQVRDEMSGHIIAQGALMGTYRR